MTLLLYSTAFIFFAKPCTYGKDYSIGERRKPLKARFWRRLDDFRYVGVTFFAVRLKQTKNSRCR